MYLREVGWAEGEGLDLSSPGQILSILPTSFTLFVFTVRTFIFPTRTANIPFLFRAIPQHIIISLIRCIAYAALLNFSAAIFLLLSSDEICFQVNILTSYLFCGAQ